MRKEEVTAKLVDIIRAAIDNSTIEADTIVADVSLDSERQLKDSTIKRRYVTLKSFFTKFHSPPCHHEF